MSQSTQTPELNGSAAAIDPRERFSKPPFPKQQQPPPGNTKDLNPPADYGEKTYTGHGRLQGRVALITGGDSGPPLRSPFAMPRKAQTSCSST